jgi:hypothetical protein
VVNRQGIEELAMPVDIVGTHEDIVNAINCFSQDYHNNFFTVRALARPYLDAAPIPATVVPLANSLRDVLIRFGAGERKAPSLRPVNQCIETLSEPGLHATLRYLANMALPSFGIIGQNRAIGHVVAPAALVEFDTNLFQALRSLASRMFINSTNVTYPMKAVLLITGLMPAFDSNVRHGLKRGGFRGMGQTRFPLPANDDNADWKKISRFPFLLGDCWNTFLPLLNDSIVGSLYPQLISHSGRLFDVLLFMQGKTGYPLVVEFHQPAHGDWYDLL